MSWAAFHAPTERGESLVAGFSDREMRGSMHAETAET
jgi:hypothetical protein